MPLTWPGPILAKSKHSLEALKSWVLLISQRGFLFVLTFSTVEIVSHYLRFLIRNLRRFWSAFQPFLRWTYAVKECRSAGLDAEDSGIEEFEVNSRSKVEYSIASESIYGWVWRASDWGQRNFILLSAWAAKRTVANELSREIELNRNSLRHPGAKIYESSRHAGLAKILGAQGGLKLKIWTVQGSWGTG